MSPFYKFLTKSFIGFFVIFIILAMVLSYIFSNILIDYETEKKVYTDMIGERVVLNDDTLTVIDASYLLNKIYLSNNNEVSFEYAKKFKVKSPEPDSPLK